MDLLNKIDNKAKFSLLFFVLGKFSFLPSAFFILTQQRFFAKVSLSLYAFLIIISLILSLASFKSRNTNFSLIKDKINKCKADDTLTIKIKDGKVVDIL